MEVAVLHLVKLVGEICGIEAEIEPAPGHLCSHMLIYLNK